MNLEAISHSIDMGDGKTITLETGKLARQADGSILLSSGNTRILATVVSAKTAREGIDTLVIERADGLLPRSCSRRSTSVVRCMASI